MYDKRRNKPPSGFYLFQIQLQSSRYKLPTNEQMNNDTKYKIIEWILQSEFRCKQSEFLSADSEGFSLFTRIF